MPECSVQRRHMTQLMNAECSDEFIQIDIGLDVPLHCLPEHQDSVNALFGLAPDD